MVPYDFPSVSLKVILIPLRRAFLSTSLSRIAWTPDTSTVVAVWMSWQQHNVSAKSMPHPAGHSTPVTVAQRMAQELLF